jgi:hypothetical protein|tara:strand:- start:146 stop:607 length:462 start_codon:yes stop_codon:yes gene_type:complete
MKTAKDLYPNKYEAPELESFSFRFELTPESYDGVYEYQPILELFGEILLQVDEDDYQGDSWVLYKNPSRRQYGYLNFGWGSCSGCDSLLACDSYKEVDELIESLRLDIDWFNTAEELIQYFLVTDFELKYYGRSADFKEFKEKALVKLKGESK